MNRMNRSNSPFSQQRSIQGPSRDKSPSPLKPKDILDNQQLDDEFVNTMLEVEQKYTVLSKHERIRIEQWTKKLCSVTTNKVWKKNRNLYAKELLSMVNLQKLREPFTRIPPEGPLSKFNKYDIERPKKSDQFLGREDGQFMNIDSRQRSVNSQHVQSQNGNNNQIYSFQQRSNSNLHTNTQSQQQGSIQQMSQQQQHIPKALQQQPQQYYGTASFNQNEYNHPSELQVQLQDNPSHLNMEMNYHPQQIGGIAATRNSPKQEGLRDSPRYNSMGKKIQEDSLIIQQQADQIKNLQVQLQISESKYSQSLSNYQEDLKNLEEQHQKSMNDLQQVLQQYNQHLNERKEENNSLQQQVKKLRNILQNIGIQIIHIKDTLPQSQSQQLDEIVQQLSDLNSDNNALQSNNIPQRQYSDANFQQTYLNDTNENYATPQSNIYNDGNSPHLAQPINNSVVSKQQMSPNIRTKQINLNNESSLLSNSQNIINSMAPGKQQTPKNNNMNTMNDGAFTNRSKTSLMNNNQQQNQVQTVNSNLNNQQQQQQQSSYNVLSSRSNSRPNVAVSNKNSLISTNRYFPSVVSQQSNLNALNNNNAYQQNEQNIHQDNATNSQQQIAQQQQQQNLQLSQAFASPQSAAAITSNTPQSGIQASSRYDQSQSQPKNTKYNDPLPVSFKNEQETQDFLNYLDNFQKRTEKLKNETSQFLKNDKYTNQQTKN